MPDNDEPLEGRIIEPRRNQPDDGEISPQEAIAALKDFLNIVGGIVSSANQERTKRQQLRTYEATAVARYKHAERTLRHYFDLEFASKNAAHKALFDAMSHALESGDNEALAITADRIVDLAKHSSLAAAGDLGNVVRAYEDPDFRPSL